jgi:hypothetical protein
MALDNGPVDYRQLQSPVEPMPGGAVPTSGRTAEAEELSAAFKQFSGEAGQLATKANTQAGAIAGAVAGQSGTPALKEGLTRFTAYSQAYNNAAIGAFVTESEIHAEDTAAKLRIQANNDPNTFASMYSAAADASVKEAPAQAQAEMRAMWNRHLTAGVSALSGAQALQIQQKNKDIYDQGTERAVSRVATLQSSDNPQDQLQAQDEHAKLVARINGGVESGLYSPAEAQAKLYNATKEITAQDFSTRVDRAISDMSDGKGDQGIISLLENFRKAHQQNLSDTSQAPVFSENEFQQLMQNAKQKLQQENIIEAYSRRDGKTAEQIKYEKSDQEVTVAMAQHMPGDQLSQLVAARVASGDLKPEVGRAVLSSIQRGFDAPVDKKAYYFAENNPDRFNWNTQEILQHVGGNAGQAAQLAAKIKAEQSGWEAHDQIKDARATVSAGLKIPSGTALELASDEDKLAAAHAQVELTRQLTMLPPDKRDAEAPRVANNVVLEMQAREAETKAAQWAKVNLSKFAPGGSRYTTDADYKQKVENAQATAKKLQDQATQLRSGIKN